MIIMRSLRATDDCASCLSNWGYILVSQSTPVIYIQSLSFGFSAVSTVFGPEVTSSRASAWHTTSSPQNSSLARHQLICC